MNWLPLSFFQHVNGLCFSSPQIGCAATYQGVSRTTDGGASWTSVLASTGPLMSVEIENNTGFAVGEGGQIYQTINGGLTWSPMTSPVTTETLNRVVITSDALAFAVGTNGTILKYDSVTGVDEDETVTASLHPALRSGLPWSTPRRCGRMPQSSRFTRAA
ncbi:MAG: hypothetical protein R3E12_18050 [Candidatus Eisenbacteria bacterium]